MIVLTCGTYGNVIRFLPPLSISDELLDEGLDVLASILAETQIRGESTSNRLPEYSFGAGEEFMTTVQNFIDGKLVDSVSGATMPLVDPATGEKYGTAPVSNEEDIDNAYAAAARAFSDWKRTTPAHRQKALLDFADEVEKAAADACRGRGPQHRQAEPRHHGRGNPADGRPDQVLRRCRKDFGGQVGRASTWRATRRGYAANPSA